MRPSIIAHILKKLRGLCRNDICDTKLVDLGADSGLGKHLDPMLDGVMNRRVIQQSIAAGHGLAKFRRIRCDAESVCPRIADLPPDAYLNAQRLRLASQNHRVFPVKQSRPQSNRTNALSPANRKDRAHASLRVTNILEPLIFLEY